jgi:hypothetical protein
LFIKQTPNDIFIFFRLKAACAVNQYATGLKQLERSARNDKLLVGHPAKIIRLQSPSHIDPATHDSRIRARRIHKHTIEWLDRRNASRNIFVEPIVMDSVDNGRAEPGNIILNDLKSLSIAIAGDNRSSVPHELSHVSRFPTWRSARIENFLSRLWIQKLTGNHSAGVLNVATTRRESGRRQPVQLHKIRIVRHRSRVRI